MKYLRLARLVVYKNVFSTKDGYTLLPSNTAFKW